KVSTAPTASHTFWREEYSAGADTSVARDITNTPYRLRSEGTRGRSPRTSATGRVSVLVARFPLPDLERVWAACATHGLGLHANRPLSRLNFGIHITGHGQRAGLADPWRDINAHHARWRAHRLGAIHAGNSQLGVAGYRRQHHRGVVNRAIGRLVCVHSPGGGLVDIAGRRTRHACLRLVAGKLTVVPGHGTAWQRCHEPDQDKQMNHRSSRTCNIHGAI